MENENKNNEDVNNSTENNSTAEEQEKNTEKLFKQADVDRIVADRLAREKTNSKKIKDDADSLVKDAQDRLTAYEEVIKGVIESKKSNIPETYRPLLDGLSLIEQYKFLTNEKNIVKREKVPETPKSEGTTEQKTEFKLPRF